MAITTLLAFLTDQKLTADAAVATARTALAAAQADLLKRRGDLSAANQQLADLAKAALKVRQDLGEAATPADVEALTPTLAKSIRDTRNQQAAIIDLESAVDQAQIALEVATGTASAAAARAAAAGAAFDAADRQDRDRSAVSIGQAVRKLNTVTISGLTGHPFIALDPVTVAGMADIAFNGDFTIASVTGTSITYPQTAADATSGGGVVFGLRLLRHRHALAAPPLSTMVADATAALAAKPWTDAKARMAADLPQQLRDCANERAKVPVADLQHKTDEAATTAALLGALSAATEDERLSFETADAALRDYVVNAKTRFDQALAIATRLADPTQNPLTAAESASIHSQKPDGTADAALQTRRNAAAAARQAIATAQIEVDVRQAAVDIARLKARTNDIDIKDVDKDTAVDAALKALKTATDSLDSAKGKFTAAMKTDLEDWQLAVPDTTWRKLSDFNDARRLLSALTVAPAPLVKAMDDAEGVLVAALITAAKVERTLAFLRGAAVESASQARFDAGSLPRRTIAALRGDQ